MADNKIVLKNIKKNPNIRYSALTPNLKGFMDAVSFGNKKNVFFFQIPDQPFI
jgi:hypothetical protein